MNQKNETSKEAWNLTVPLSVKVSAALDAAIRSCAEADGVARYEWARSEVRNAVRAGAVDFPPTSDEVTALYNLRYGAGMAAKIKAAAAASDLTPSAWQRGVLAAAALRQVKDIAD